MRADAGQSAEGKGKGKGKGWQRETQEHERDMRDKEQKGYCWPCVETCCDVEGVSVPTTAQTHECAQEKEGQADPRRLAHIGLLGRQ